MPVLPSLDSRAQHAMLPCKVCGGNSVPYGMADFNKSCEDRTSPLLPPRGVEVRYHRCARCRLLFTAALDNWSKDDYLAHIYNDDYIEVDPDYIEKRPLHNKLLMANLLGEEKGLRVLDYGGGNGRLAQELASAGYRASSWDPMDRGAVMPAQHAFDVISAFEVFEHTPEPLQTFAQILSFLNTDGILLFSTLTLDDLPPGGMQHFYIAPRNGHITLHSSQSLDIMAQQQGYRVHHFDPLIHLVFKYDLPAWLRNRSA
jgi:SAM-dependent methyltransferase